MEVEVGDEVWEVQVLCFRGSPLGRSELYCVQYITFIPSFQYPIQ